MAQPEMDLEPIPESGADATPLRPSWGLKVALAFALVLGSAVAFVPPLFLGWFFGGTTATLYAAETLELTGGLDRDVFAQCYWLSLGINAAFLAWGLVRLAMRKAHPWRPLFWLTLTYALAFGLLVTLDARGVADMPDGVTTTALLGLAWLWNYVLPVVLVVLMVKLAITLWRAAAASAAVARRVIAGFVVAALAAAYVIGSAAIPGPDLDVDLSAAFTGPIGAPPGDVQAERTAYVRTAAAVTTPRERALAGKEIDGGELAACMNELAKPQLSARSTLERAIAQLRRSMRQADAEDVAYASLLKTCVRHAKQPIRVLAEYFWKAVANGAKTLCGRSARFQLAPSDELPQYESCDRFKDTLAGHELYQVLGRLSAEDQMVLRLHYFEGRDFAEVGVRLGVTEATARQRSRRALSKAYEALAVR